MALITVLSRQHGQLTTVKAQAPSGYDTGVLLTHWSRDRRSSTVSLDRAELLAFLRALPTALLLESLGERGLTEALDLDDTPQPGENAPVPERCCPPKIPSDGDTVPHLHWCLQCGSARRCQALACEVMTTSQGLRYGTPIVCQLCGGTGSPGDVPIPTQASGTSTVAPANLFFGLDEPTLGQEG